MENTKLKVVLDAVESVGYEVEAAVTNSPSILPAPIGSIRTIENGELVTTDRVMVVISRTTRMALPTA